MANSEKTLHMALECVVDGLVVDSDTNLAKCDLSSDFLQDVSDPFFRASIYKANFALRNPNIRELADCPRECENDGRPLGTVLVDLTSLGSADTAPTVIRCDRLVATIEVDAFLHDVDESQPNWLLQIVDRFGMWLDFVPVLFYGYSGIWATARFHSTMVDCTILGTSKGLDYVSPLSVGRRGRQGAARIQRVVGLRRDDFDSRFMLLQEATTLSASDFVAIYGLVAALGAFDTFEWKTQGHQRIESLMPYVSVGAEHLIRAFELTMEHSTGPDEPNWSFARRLKKRCQRGMYRHRNLQANEVYDRIRAVYDYRCDFVHGSNESKPKCAREDFAVCRAVLGCVLEELILEMASSGRGFQAAMSTLLQGSPKRIF